MKKTFVMLCALCLGQAMWTGAEAVQVRQKAPAMDQKPLKIVFDNDVHGSINRYEYLAGYRDALKEAGYPVLTVSVGDYLQGSAYAAVSKGQFCIDLMNAVGYDVVAIGNHDIDYGVKRLLALRDSLDKKTAMVCANLYDGNKEHCLPAFTFCNVGGYHVAFVGVLTTATELLEANVVNDEQGNPECSFGKDSLVQIVQKAIDIVRLGNPDWVILLTHMGVDPLDDHMASWQLLEQLHGVDVVLDGHSHSVVNTTMLSGDASKDAVAVAQTGFTMANVGCLTLERGEQPRVKLYSYENLPQSASVHKTYRDVVDQMQPILGQVVGYTPFDLKFYINNQRAVRRQETNLGNLVADAYRHELGTDIGWVNGGGIRAGLVTGDITYGQVVNVSPFNNFMCIAQVTGQMIADALEECYSKCPGDLGSFAHVSGLRCTLDTTIHNQLSWNEKGQLVVNGKRRVSKIEVEKNGVWRPLEMKEVLTLGGSDYVVYEGESRGLRNAKILQDKVMTDTECFQKYIMNTLQGTIPERYREAQGRIRYKK